MLQVEPDLPESREHGWKQAGIHLSEVCKMIGSNLVESKGTLRPLLTSWDCIYLHLASKSSR